MNEEKYYTPTIEEFFVGFEYEYFPAPCLHREINDGYIKKSLVSHPNYLGSIASQLEAYQKSIRVKYLDKSDLEDLGFNEVAVYTSNTIYEKQIPDSMDILYVSTRERNELTLGIRHYYDKNIQFIGDRQDFSQYFGGIIKNKSELIRLMKQLELL